MEREVGSELVYILPDQSSRYFEDMLAKLEEKSKAIKIAGYGISLATMEDVFMR